MEKNEGLVPDLEQQADFTGFREDHLNKAIEGGVGEVKVAPKVSTINPTQIQKKKKIVAIFDSHQGQE